jgi:hypothetical protein
LWAARAPDVLWLGRSVARAAIRQAQTHGVCDRNVDDWDPAAFYLLQSLLIRADRMIE